MDEQPYDLGSSLQPGTVRVSNATARPEMVDTSLARAELDRLRAELVRLAAAADRPEAA